MTARVALLVLGAFAASLAPGFPRAAGAQPTRPFNPMITSLSPSAGVPGTVVDAVLQGMDLAGGTIQVSGSGVRILDAAVQDPTTHVLRIYIEPDAPPGSRTVFVTVTSGGMTKMAATTFSVLPP